MRTFLPLLLSLCLLAGCTPAQTPLPSENVSNPVDAFLYLPDEGVMHLEITHTTLPSLSPQALLDALITAGVQPEGLRVVEFELQENNSAFLKLSEEFKTALSSTGTTGELLLTDTVCYTFLDTFRLDTLYLTCEGAPFETGHTEFDTIRAEYGSLMSIQTDLDAYLHQSDGSLLSYDDAAVIYSWEEEKKSLWEEELKRTNQDFTQNYYAILNPNPALSTLSLSADPIIRLNLATRQWISATPSELAEYLSSCETPPLFQVELNEAGAITHLLEYDLDGTD